MPTKLPKAAPPSRLIGYARVSTEEQGTDPQLDELRAAGCATVLEEHASGADRRPVLARLLHEIRPGETLVVVRLDRLARSVSHLLAVIEQLEAAGAHFRSLRDPIDTTTPQGMFSLQVLGAVAQLERALIAERTKAGRRAAAVVSAAIPACAPETRTPSARSAPAATRRIWTVSWPGWTRGCRL
jgi:DNA invertase Pin-like site-specific DNA recombinase